MCSSDLDAGKLLVRSPHSGAALARTLREDYGFETEMSCGPNVLAMTSVADDEDALDRLAAALLAIDRCLPQGTAPAQAAVLPPPGPAVYTIAAALRRPRPRLRRRLRGSVTPAAPPILQRKGFLLFEFAERMIQEKTPAFLQRQAFW